MHGDLAAGRAFADLSFWRKVRVSGADARPWLNDLVSADIGDLEPGQAVRSLLLTPTGRIRAEFTVACVGRDHFLLLQDPDQANSVLRLLAPYVLSSEVDLHDATDAFAVFAFPGLPSPPEVVGCTPSAPSTLGRGVDLICPAADRDTARHALEGEFGEAGNEDVERWRIAAGIPRVAVDATAEDLPQEVGLEDAVAFGKGCYLGQEAMAKVRNLGHPRRVLLALQADGSVSPGDPVMVSEDEAGEVTSAAQDGGRTAVLAKVRWAARAGPFRTRLGVALEPRHGG